METRKEIIKQMGDAMREDILRTQLAQKVLVENICGRRLRHAFVQHLQLYLFPRRLQETEQPNGRDGESDGNAILRSPVWRHESDPQRRYDIELSDSFRLRAEGGKGERWGILRGIARQGASLYR